MQGTKAGCIEEPKITNTLIKLKSWNNILVFTENIAIE